MSLLLKHPIVSTLGISAVIITIAVILSIVSYQMVGQKDPGLLYEVLSALGISSLLAPTFLYPWIRTAAKLRLASAELEKVARTDALTGLPNSAVFRNRIEDAIASMDHDGPFAILFIDLDHFKQINDTLGHPRGDALLVCVAGRLIELARDSDFVARFGGDEFVVLLSRVSSTGEVSELARRIVDSISAPYDVDGHEIVIGASIGIAVAPTDGVGPTELLRNADMALYQAKSFGKRTWRFFEASMAVAAQARRNLAVDLRAALASDAFELRYQPILCVRSMRITTCEALIRWRQAGRGIVLPAEFIPVAEEMGVIVEIGSWVLHQACMECSKWPSDVRVAVNLSPIQFRRGNIAEVISAALAQAGLPADRLELEITESVLLQDFPETRTILEQLRRLGVRISLDDFGTGYSALSYLHTLPLDKVKIDQSFVRSLATDDRALTLLRAVAKLSWDLGLAVAVEGIETEDQFRIITAEDFIDEVQGFLFSPSLPSREIEQLLSTSSRSSAKLMNLGS